jgi:amidase
VTKDCFSNQITKETDLFESVGWATINPATGPLYVEGCVTGDALRVDILDIQMNSPGVMVAVPGLGALGDLISRSRTKLVPIEDGHVLFSEEIKVPINPMIGVIGVAPEDEPVACGTPGLHGGNMDTRQITVGASVYLPVNVPGALLCVGDLHAAMGDGEVVVCGAEVSGSVTARVRVVPELYLPCPVVEDKDATYFVYSAHDLDAAARGALLAAVNHITSRTKIDLPEAGMLLSLAGHLEISQIVDPLMTSRLKIPTWLGDKLGVRFGTLSG